jgi:hypothetical protein
MRSRAVLAAAVLAVGIGVTACGGGPNGQNWYAAGKSFALSDSKVDTAKIIGPPGSVQKWCTGILDSGNAPVPTGPLPSTTNDPAVTQWVSGCAAGYAQSQPSDPNGTSGTVWDTSPAEAASPSPSYTPLSLTCSPQYWIPEMQPFMFGSASATGWQPMNGPQNDLGGDNPPPSGWPNSQALSATLPTGWKQGAQVVISDSGTAPPQPADGYHVTVTFRDAGGKTVYATSVNAKLQPPQGYETQPGTNVNVSAGTSATGAVSCLATVSAAG